MDSRYHRGALAFKTVNQMNVPQWFSTVHHWSEDLSCKIDQLFLAAGSIDLYLKDMTFEVEVIIDLPGRMSDTEGIGSNNLLVPRQQVHFGINHCVKIVERDLTFEDAHASN